VCKVVAGFEVRVSVIHTKPQALFEPERLRRVLCALREGDAHSVVLKQLRWRCAKHLHAISMSVMRTHTGDIASGLDSWSRCTQATLTRFRLRIHLASQSRSVYRYTLSFLTVSGPSIVAFRSYIKCWSASGFCECEKCLLSPWVEWSVVSIQNSLCQLRGSLERQDTLERLWIHCFLRRNRVSAVSDGARCSGFLQGRVVPWSYATSLRVTPDLDPKLICMCPPRHL
jgi:hypothetical protein